MRHLLLLATLITLTVQGFSQSSPELDALEEIFFAKDIATVAKHLPPEMEKALLSLSPVARAAVAKEILIGEKIKREGGKVTRLTTGADLLLVEEIQPDRRSETARLILDRRISDGTETFLRIREGEREYRDIRLELWMRYVDGEWRIYEFEGLGTSIDLSDPARARRYRNPVGFENETSASSRLRNFFYEMRHYRSVLNRDPAPRHSFEESDESGEPKSPELPREESGYKFEADVSSAAFPQQYTVLARPVQYGATGTRSFYSDESGVIRFTDEDREPTAEDRPLR